VAWRDLRHRVRQRMADFLELPREVVLDLPKIVVVGDVQVLIENHRGIVAYGPDQVRVSVGEREVTVHGRELVLRHVRSEELLVEGRITGLSFR